MYSFLNMVLEADIPNLNDVAETIHQIGFAGFFQQMLDKVKSYLPAFISALIFLLSSLAICSLIMFFVRKSIARSKIDPMLHYFVATLVKYILFGIVFISTIDVAGFSTTSIITALGAVGLAFSLAIKDSLSNLAGGVFLLFNRPFKTGDYIELKGVSGTVKEIRLTYTLLQTNYNRNIFIPNGDFSSVIITNYSMSDTRCMELTFSIKPDSDIDKATAIISDVLARSEHMLPNHQPIVRISDQTETWIKITCMAWVAPADLLDYKSYAIKNVRQKFVKEGIQ